MTGRRHLISWEVRELYRDPFAASWVGMLAILAYVLVFAFALERSEYFLRVTLVLVPLGIVFIIGGRRSAVRDAAFRDLLTAQGVTPSDVFWARFCAGIAFSLIYLVLVAPLLMWYFAHFPLLRPLIAAGIVGYWLQMAAVISTALLLAAHPSPRAPLMQGGYVLASVAAGTAVALISPASRVVHAAGLLFPSVGATYLQATFVSVRLSLSYSAITLIVIAAAMLLVSHGRWSKSSSPRWIFVIAGGIAIAASSVAASEIEPQNDRKTILSLGAFNIRMFWPDGTEIPSPWRAEIGEPREVSLRIQSVNREPSGPTTFRVGGEGLRFNRTEIVTDVTASSAAFPVTITPEPLFDPRDQTYVLVMEWIQPETTKTSTVHIKGESPEFILGVRILAGAGAIPFALAIAREARLRRAALP